MNQYLDPSQAFLHRFLLKSLTFWASLELSKSHWRIYLWIGSYFIMKVAKLQSHFTRVKMLRMHAHRKFHQNGFARACRNSQLEIAHRKSCIDKYPSTWFRRPCCATRCAQKIKKNGAPQFRFQHNDQHDSPLISQKIFSFFCTWTWDYVSKEHWKSGAQKS